MGNYVNNVGLAYCVANLKTYIDRQFGLIGLLEAVDVPSITEIKNQYLDKSCLSTLASKFKTYIDDNVPIIIPSSNNSEIYFLEFGENYENDSSNYEGSLNGLLWVASTKVNTYDDVSWSTIDISFSCKTSSGSKIYYVVLPQLILLETLTEYKGTSYIGSISPDISTVENNSTWTYNSSSDYIYSTYNNHKYAVYRTYNSVESTSSSKLSSEQCTLTLVVDYDSDPLELATINFYYTYYPNTASHAGTFSIMVTNTCASLSTYTTTTVELN